MLLLMQEDEGAVMLFFGTSTWPLLLAAVARARKRCASRRLDMIVTTGAL